MTCVTDFLVFIPRKVGVFIISIQACLQRDLPQLYENENMKIWQQIPVKSPGL